MDHGVVDDSGDFPALNVIVGDVVEFSGTVLPPHQFAVKDSQGTVLITTAGAPGAPATFVLTWEVPAAGTYAYYCPPLASLMKG